MATILLSQQFNYEVTTARTLADAVRLAKGERFDLYLLDYLLPDGTAFDLCRLIREFDSVTPALLYAANVSFNR
jgi:DNA-binding response OmpR family regulator